MDESTWCHHCAVTLQERATALTDDLADYMAAQLRETYAPLSPWQAARRFFDLAESD